MARAEPTKIRQIFLLTSAVAIVNTGFGIIFPIFPKFLTFIGDGDASDLGNMAAMFGFTFLIFSPIFGNLADRLGKKPIILTGLIGFVFSNFLYILADDIVMLYMARAFEGAFAGAVFPPAMALVTDLAPDDKKAKYIGILTAGQTAGIIIGPLLGGVLLDGITIYGFTIVGSIYMPFYASIVIGSIAVIFSYIFIHPVSTPNIQIDASLEESKSRGIKRVISHNVKLLPKPRKAFLIFILVEIGAMSAWLVLEPGIIFYFYDDLFLSPTDFGIWVGVFAITAVFGNLFLGQLSDKFGRKPMILLGQLFSTAFYFLLPYQSDLFGLSLIVLLVGIGSGLREPAMKALLTDVTDPAHRATIFGIEAGLMSISQIASPIIGGYIYVTSGISSMFLIAMAIAVINIVLIPMIYFNRFSPPGFESDIQPSHATTGIPGK